MPRDINEEARDDARALMKTERYRHSARQRKKIETLFGDVKRNLALTKLRLRGLSGATDEFLLTATATVARLNEDWSRNNPKNPEPPGIGRKRQRKVCCYQ